MFYEDDKSEIRSRLPEYVNMITEKDRRGGRDMYVCPLCGSGSESGRGHNGAFHVTGDRWYCHSCHQGGDIFTLIGAHEGLSEFPDQLRRAKEIFNISTAPAEFTRVEKKTPKPIEHQKDTNRASQIEDFASQIAGSPAEKYLHSRGFSDDTIRKFKLGFNPKRYVTSAGREFESVVIPYPGEDYFTERLINPGEADKYQNQTGSTPIFEIREKDSKYYFLTEGQLDALSMYQAGAKNVVACHYPSKLEAWIDSKGDQLTGVVIVGDRDPEDKREKDGKTPGERQAEQMSEVLSEKKIKNVIVYPPEGCKDSNDLLRRSQSALKAFLEESFKRCQEAPEIGSDGEKTSLSAISIQEYIGSGGFSADIEYFKQYKDRKTGFSNIDKYLTLYPGLACLTGATSLGKTSFAVQLADQLVDRGETVLYFTLEQSVFDIASKSIARKYYQSGLTNFNNTDIMSGATDETLQRVIKGFDDRSDRFKIVECDFTITADDIVAYINGFVKETGVKPIFIIDYLQIVSPPEGSRFDEREKVDDAVKKFKLMQRNNGLFGVLISNMARSSYKERVGEESFKESGLIEYTCDYLWGLQLAILEDDSFFSKIGVRGGEKQTANFEKEEELYQASAKIPKEVVFKNMKQRKGKKVFKAFFKYRPDFDCFEVDNNSPYDRESPDNQFRPISENEDFPFKTV